jgi:cell surface protein SprA
MESRLENFKVTDQTYIPRNSNVYGNFGMSTILLRTAFNRSGDVESRNFQNFRDYRKQIAERLVQGTYFEDSGFGEEGVSYRIWKKSARGSLTLLHRSLHWSES